MNKFSIYQYLLILVVLIVGSLYALPNLYPTQPSIQVAYTDSGRSADQSLLNDLESILDKSQTDYEEMFLRENKWNCQKWIWRLKVELEICCLGLAGYRSAASRRILCISAP